MDWNLLFIITFIYATGISSICCKLKYRRSTCSTTCLLTSEPCLLARDGMHLSHQIFGISRTSPHYSCKCSIDTLNKPDLLWLFSYEFIEQTRISIINTDVQIPLLRAPSFLTKWWDLLDLTKKKSFWIWFICTLEGCVLLLTYFFLEKMQLWNTLTHRLDRP